MKKLMKKAGYISIELIVVAGIILVAGLFAINNFISKGKTATSTANGAIDNALSAAQAGA